jgi:hypothetical protein
MFRSREILWAPVTDERESRGVTRVKHACLTKKKAAGDEGEKPMGRKQQIVFFLQNFLQFKGGLTLIYISCYE